MQIHVFSQKRLSAVQAEIFHDLIAPTEVFFCYATPALFAYGQFFAFKLDVEFDVPAFASGFPRVFTMFHFAKPHISQYPFWVKFAFKTRAETDIGRCGEMS
jgi:hypothetical protein